jgi:hypothetical protein
VNDWICWIWYAVADRTGRHVQSPVGLRKYKGIQHLRNMKRGRQRQVLQTHNTRIAGQHLHSNCVPQIQTQ